MRDMKIVHGSGNVFIDLGFEKDEAEQLLVKAHLFHNLQDAICATKLTQVKIGKKLGIDQSKVSKILRGKISEFSVERILSYLLKLRWDVIVDTHPAPSRFARGRVLENGKKSARAAVCNRASA